VTDVEEQKRLAAEAAVGLVHDGLRVGLGSGSTVAYLIRALGARRPRARFVASSPASAEAALAEGLEVVSGLDALDLTIDGADQVSPDGWLVKGGGRAHTREKVVVAASARFVVIVSQDKLVEAIRPPIPLELLRFEVEATLRACAPARLRDGPPSPDGGLIADYTGPIGDPAELAGRLDAVPGVVEHGLFPPALVHEILVGTPEGVQRIVPPGR
jgi:ribose 5-phosphate isomerase A